MQKIVNNILNKPKQSFEYFESAPEYNVSYFPSKSGLYKIEIDSLITSVSQFSTAISALDNAKPEDQIEIHLSCCPGGSVDAGDTFIHAMRKCEAPIHIIAGGGNHSMATHILLECDSFELSDGFCALLHAGYDGAGGTVNEYHTKSAFDLEFRTRKFREAYKHFLTDDEITNMLKGVDIWLDAEQWCERATNRMEIMKAEYEAEEALEESATPSRKPSKPSKQQSATQVA